MVAGPYSTHLNALTSFLERTVRPLANPNQRAGAGHHDRNECQRSSLRRAGDSNPERPRIWAQRLMTLAGLPERDVGVVDHDIVV